MKKCYISIPKLNCKDLKELQIVGKEVRSREIKRLNGGKKKLSIKCEVASCQSKGSSNLCSKSIKLQLGPQEDLSVQDVMSPFHAEKI